MCGTAYGSTRSEYTGGLKILLERAANFVDARLEHYPTVTAVGHL